jgi:hypothetical protein
METDKNITKMSKCFYCGEDITWQNDYDTDDVGGDEQYLIVTMYQCSNKECGAWYEVSHGKKEEGKLN